MGVDVLLDSDLAGFSYLPGVHHRLGRHGGRIRLLGLLARRASSRRSP